MNTEPFLPSQRKPSRMTPARNTVLLWLLLVLMFVTIYQFLSPPPSPHASAHPSTSPDFRLPVLGALGALMAFVIWMLVLQRRNLRRAIVLNGVGMDFLARGEHGKARAAFESMMAKYGRVPSVKVTARHNLGWTLLIEGNLAQATAELVGLQQAGLRQVMPSLQARSAAELALCYALAGDVTAAATWRAEAAQQRASDSDPPTLMGHLAVVDAVIGCRSGKPADVTRSLDNGWETLSGLHGDLSRPLRLLRAFALAAAGGPRDDGAVDRLLAPLREGRPGSLRYLGVAWPELAAFMDTHHI